MVADSSLVGLLPAFLEVHSPLAAVESILALLFAVLQGVHLRFVLVCSNRVSPFDVLSGGRSSLVAVDTILWDSPVDPAAVQSSLGSADATLLRLLIDLAVDQSGLEAADSTLLRSLLGLAVDQYGLEAAGFHLAGLSSVQSVAHYYFPFVGAMLLDTSPGFGFERLVHWGRSSFFAARHSPPVVAL